MLCNYDKFGYQKPLLQVLRYIIRDESQNLHHASQLRQRWAPKIVNEWILTNELSPRTEANKKEAQIYFCVAIFYHLKGEAKNGA